MLPSAALDAVLAHLALYYLAATRNDLNAARHAASTALADYNAATIEQLHLAAAIISFGFQALDALAEAAAPDLSLNRKIRLRGSAVSLSREAHKARRKLEHLQRPRQPAPENLPAQQPNPPAEPPAPQPTFTPPLSRQQRRAAERTAAKQQRRLAELARREALRTIRTPPAAAALPLYQGTLPSQ